MQFSWGNRNSIGFPGRKLFGLFPGTVAARPDAMIKSPNLRYLKDMSTKRAIWLANAALLILSSAALIRIAAKDGLGSFDFHCFWYGGNLIWQGTDPYRAFIEKQKVELPINYIDSVTVEEGPIDPFDRQCAPGNAAPVLFFLYPLARLSWEAAHNTWFILNILFAVMIGGIPLKDSRPVGCIE